MTQRLFIFAIGGTGSRVLKSLIMLLAAGHPIDAREIIPIIIDPDNQNGNLSDTETLLKAYQVVNKNAVPNAATEGFFRPKVRTLADIDATGMLTQNNFNYDFGESTNGTFSDFINYHGLGSLDKKFIDVLFSKDNLDSELTIGFKGNPNVGSIVLNSFENSPEFKLFTNIFDKDKDRVFIISSIFGGTGASGFPLLVKLIRNNDADNVNRALIGAISVAPYFNIGKLEQDTLTAKIDSDTFVTKTKAALSYYETNLKVNALFYLSDKLTTNPYKPALGGSEQRNDAHLIELIGATSIIKFCQLPKTAIDPNGRAFEYGLAAAADTITFQHMPEQNSSLSKSLLLFKYLSHLVNHHIPYKSTNLAWAQSIGFNANFISSDTYQQLKFVLNEFEKWLNELEDNRRSFSPFAKTKDMSQFMVHKTIKHGYVTNYNEDEFDRSFNTNSQSVKDLPDVNKKFLALMWKGINGVFENWVKTI